MKKRGIKNKKGQIMGMPFIMIFSLILVAVALFVGIWAIKGFLERAEQASINDFVKNQLEYEISKIWSGPEEAQVIRTLILSKNFDYICFFDQSKECLPVQQGFCQEYRDWKITGKENLFLLPLGKAENYGTYTAWSLKCGTKECFNFIRNPTCIQVENGKVKVKLIKESGKPFVLVSQA